jgi:phosphinothricin acetyltransferase
VRAAEPNDLSAIVAIYNSTIASRMVTADLEPVSIEQKRVWFESHCFERPIVVHEQAGQVVAWVSFEPFKPRAAYDATAEISIYLDKTVRGRGLGRQLLEEAMAQARDRGLTSLLAFIFSHNLPSLRLFTKAGFSLWGELPDIARLDGQARSLSILGRRLD